MVWLEVDEEEMMSNVVGVLVFVLLLGLNWF